MMNDLKSKIDSLVTILSGNSIGSTVIENSESTIFKFYDLMVILENDRTRFGGLVFEALGRDFIVTPDYEILVTGIDDGINESNSFEVSDKNFLNLLENFIEWRLNVIDKLRI